MKKLTKEQLAQEMKEHKQETQLKFIGDLLDTMEHLARNLANLTMRVDYDPSYQETQKILAIKRYADTMLKNID